MVNRCICSNISFEKIKVIAENENFVSVEELRAENICCCNCQLCVPYVEAMLETGKTAFHPYEIKNFG